MDEPEPNVVADAEPSASAASVVLVTNVGQGFGRAIALGYGRAAYDVVCADRDVDLASRTAAEVEELGGQAIPIQADMTTQIDVSNAFRKVLEIFGRLGGVVHVANQDSHTPFRDLGEPEFAELVDENLRSCFLTLRAARRQLEHGWVVLVAPPTDNREPHMAALRSGLRGLVAGMHPARDDGAREPLRVNLVEPSRAPADPAHDAQLVDTVLFLGSVGAAAIEGQRFAVHLPPPPQVVESLLPEVRAALDSSVRQDEQDDDLNGDEPDGDHDEHDDPDDLGDDADDAYLAAAAGGAPDDASDDDADAPAEASGDPTPATGGPARRRTRR